PRLLIPTLFPYTTLFRSHDVRKRRQRVIGQIRSELRELHYVACLLRKEMYVAVVGEGVVRLHVGISHVAGVSDSRQTLHVGPPRSEEHTSELQSRGHLVC